MLGLVRILHLWGLFLHFYHENDNLQSVHWCVPVCVCVRANGFYLCEPYTHKCKPNPTDPTHPVTVLAVVLGPIAGAAHQVLYLHTHPHPHSPTHTWKRAHTRASERAHACKQVHTRARVRTCTHRWSIHWQAWFRRLDFFLGYLHTCTCILGYACACTHKHRRKLDS